MLAGKLPIFINIGKTLLIVMDSFAHLAFFQANFTQEEGGSEGRGMIAEVLCLPVSFEKALPGHLHLTRKEGHETPDQKVIMIQETVPSQERLGLMGTGKHKG